MDFFYNRIGLSKKMNFLQKKKCIRKLNFSTKKSIFTTQNFFFDECQLFWRQQISIFRFGAKDFNANAIKIACNNGNDELIQCLLARCSHLDLEHKLNETDLLIDCNFGETLPSYCNTYCNLFPTHPTVINWNFETCQLNGIKWVAWQSWSC